MLPVCENAGLMRTKLHKASASPSVTVGGS